MCHGERIDVPYRKAILRNVPIFLVVQVHVTRHEDQPLTCAAIERDSAVVEHSIRSRRDDRVRSRAETMHR